MPPTPRRGRGAASCASGRLGRSEHEDLFSERRMLTDRICGLGVLLMAGLVLSASGVRWIMSGPTRYARVEADGGSVLLGQSLMNMVYWALQPVAGLCIALGLTANFVTGCSLVLGAFSGIAMG